MRPVLCFFVTLSLAHAAPVTEDVEIPANHYVFRVAPADGAGVELFRLNTSKMNQAAHDGQDRSGSKPRRGGIKVFDQPVDEQLGASGQGQGD